MSVMIKESPISEKAMIEEAEKAGQREAEHPPREPPVIGK